MHALVVGLGLLELELGSEQQLLELRVREVHKNGVRSDFGAGEHADADDGCVSLRRNELDRVLAGNQRAEAAYLDDHGAALHRVGPDGACVHRGNGWFEVVDAEGGGCQNDNGNSDPNSVAAELFLLDIGPGYIHHGTYSCTLSAIRGDFLNALKKRFRPPGGWAGGAGIDRFRNQVSGNGQLRFILPLRRKSGVSVAFPFEWGSLWSWMHCCFEILSLYKLFLFSFGLSRRGYLSFSVEAPRAHERGRLLTMSAKNFTDEKPGLRYRSAFGDLAPIDPGEASLNCLPAP